MFDKPKIYRLIKLTLDCFILYSYASFLFYIKRVMIILCVMYLSFADKTTAQTIHPLPPDQPEQDACNALHLCGTPCFTGTGGGEVNSVWLKVNVLTSGSLVFKIMPVNHDDDYDFAVI